MIFQKVRDGWVNGLDVTSELPKAVVLLSGGMDSAALLYLMKDAGYDPVALSVMYGQRHEVELGYAKTIAQSIGAEHQIVNLKSLRDLLAGSSQTSDIPVPEGHYSSDNMKVTVVPNRNAILLAIAYGLATSIKAKKVCTAVHAGDHAQYPDCRPEFIKAFEEMEKTSITRETYEISTPSLYAPFLMMSKADIVKVGHELHVPWVNTRSCYTADEVACGRCGTDVERIWAFNAAGVLDPTEYQDKQYAIDLLKEKGEWI